jgi:hypothetical protein
MIAKGRTLFRKANFNMVEGTTQTQQYQGLWYSECRCKIRDFAWLSGRNIQRNLLRVEKKRVIHSILGMFKIFDPVLEEIIQYSDDGNFLTVHCSRTSYRTCK